MPSRWLTIVIVVVWFATTGKLVVDDLLPRLLPDTPPSLAIELTEEPKMERPSVFWNVLQDGKRVMRAKTQVKRIGRDEYELSAIYDPTEGKKDIAISGLLIRKMSSSYRINAAGDLLGVKMEVVGKPNLADWLKMVQENINVSIAGEVIEGKLAPHVTVSLSDVEEKRQVPEIKKRIEMLPEIKVPRGGTVLSPLHPANRVRNLVKGQTWTVPMYEPVSDSLGVLRGINTVPPLIRAKVRGQIEAFPLNRNKAEECLVVDYSGEGFSGTTWVSTTTSLVLMQEAVLGKTRWTMIRD